MNMTLLITALVAYVGAAGLLLWMWPRRVHIRPDPTINQDQHGEARRDALRRAQLELATRPKRER